MSSEQGSLTSESKRASTPRQRQKSGDNASPLHSGKKLRQLRLPFAPINAARKRRSDDNDHDHANENASSRDKEKGPVAKAARVDENDGSNIEPEVVIVEEKRGEKDRKSDDATRDDVTNTAKPKINGNRVETTKEKTSTEDKSQEDDKNNDEDVRPKEAGKAADVTTKEVKLDSEKSEIAKPLNSEHAKDASDKNSDEDDISKEVTKSATSEDTKLESPESDITKPKNSEHAIDATDKEEVAKSPEYSSSSSSPGANSSKLNNSKPAEKTPKRITPKRIKPQAVTTVETTTVETGSEARKVVSKSSEKNEVDIEADKTCDQKASCETVTAERKSTENQKVESNPNEADSTGKETKVKKCIQLQRVDKVDEIDDTKNLAKTPAVTKKRVQLQRVDTKKPDTKNTDTSSTETKDKNVVQRVQLQSVDILKDKSTESASTNIKKKRRITPQSISLKKAESSPNESSSTTSQLPSLEPFSKGNASSVTVEEGKVNSENVLGGNKITQSEDPMEVEEVNQIEKGSSFTTDSGNDPTKAHVPIVTINEVKETQETLQTTPKSAKTTPTSSKRSTAKKAESAAKKQERERQLEEKRLKKEEERRRKDDIKHKRLEVKRLKDQEKETKDRLKREREEARLEEQQRKLEEQQHRLEEQQKKLMEQRERRRRVEARRSNTEREASAFSKFFIKKTSDNANTSITSSNCSRNVEEEEGPFNQFRVKPHMRLASSSRRVLTDEKKQKLDAFVSVIFPLIDTSKLYLCNELKSEGYEPGKALRTWPPSNSIEDEIEVEPLSEPDEINSADAVIDNDNSSVNNGQNGCTGSSRMKAKLLQFCENERPAFFGTFRKRSKNVSGRRPFSKDGVHVVNYDYDSDEDWEEEEQGESLSSDDEKDNEDENEDEVEEEDDGFFVGHGVLAKDERLPDEDEDCGQVDGVRFDEELEARKQRLIAEQFEADYGKSKTVKKLKPRVFGCLWQNEGTKDAGDAIVKEHLTKFLGGFAAAPFFPVANVNNTASQ